MRPSLALALVSIACAAGCALTSKGEPLEIRYFAPESPELPPTARPVSTASSLRLALGEVRGSSYLRERIMYRASANELGFYDEHRWTDRPATYLRRALARELFERRGVSPVFTGPGPTLEVQLISFEEVRAPKRVARFEGVYFLYGGGIEGVERSVALELAILDTKDPMEGAVKALSQAVALGAERIADEVLGALAAQPLPAPALESNAPIPSDQDASSQRFTRRTDVVSTE